MKRIRLTEQAYQILKSLNEASGEDSVTKTLNRLILELGDIAAGENNERTSNSNATG